MRITNGGAVGIGVTPSGSNLDIGGASAIIHLTRTDGAGGISSIDSSAGYSANYNNLRLRANTANAGLASWNIDLGGALGEFAGADSFSIGRASAGGGTYGALMSITSAGAVGIGVTPDVPLHVKSAANAYIKMERADNSVHAAFAIVNTGAYADTNRIWLVGKKATSEDLTFWNYDGSVDVNAVTIAKGGNLGLMTSTFGANSVSVLAIANGTAPAAHVDNEIQIYSSDTGDNTATFSIMCEQAVEAIGTFTASHKFKVRINGTLYWWTLDAV
jgi:hypothetical protein